MLQWDVLIVMCLECSPGLLEELSQSSELLSQCLSVDTGQLICNNNNINNNNNNKDDDEP